MSGLPPEPARQITVVGLGPGPWDLLSLRAARCLEQAGRLVLRTGHLPLAAELEARGIPFSTFDDYYERFPTFEEVYEAMARTLLDLSSAGPVVYGVPGHPLVGEASVQALARLAQPEGVRLELVVSPGSVEAVWAELGVDPLAVGAALIDGHELARWATAPEKLPPPAGRLWERHRGYLVLQVDSPLVAQAVKALVGETFGDEHRVAWVQAAGSTARVAVKWLPVYELDRGQVWNHETSLYVPPAAEDRLPTASELAGVLVRVMAALRSPRGCPWDRKQTHESLRRYLLEEAYEAVHAIESGDRAALRDELGDLLLQVLFHAQLASEQGEFSMADVEAALQSKLVRRHPHVFGEAQAQDAAEVLRNWEAIKAKERETSDPPRQGRAGGDGGPASLMDGLAPNLPALALAEAVQRRAARVGFEWPDISGAGRKAVEEARELREAWARQEREAAYRELGDLLFAVVNVARYMKVDPELACRDAAFRFIQRFRRMEELARQDGRALADMSLDEMDALWVQAKEEMAGTR